MSGMTQNSAEHPAITQLRDHQRQLDADGCEVGVSRQAIDETLEIVGELLDAAVRLIVAFDELQATTTAERLITGRSDREIRNDSNEAIADLRAAITRATGK